MNLRRAFCILGAGGIVLSAIYAFQRPFRVYPSMEPYDDISAAAGLSGQNRLGLRASDVSAASRTRGSAAAACASAAGDWRQGGTSWTAGLSARRPAFRAGAAAA